MMKKFNNPVSKKLNFLGMGLMIITIIVMFVVPFWKYEGTQVSMITYMCFPIDYVALDQWFYSTFGIAHSTNYLVTVILLVFVPYFITCVLYVTKSENGVVALIPFLASICGIVGYSIVPAYSIGMNLWIYYVLCAVVGAVSLSSFVISVIKSRKISDVDIANIK